MENSASALSPAGESTGAAVPFRWLALTIPLVLLVAEVALLTLHVEYRHGLMQWVAHPLIVQAILIAGTLLLLLRGGDLARTADFGHLSARLAFLVVNVGTFVALYGLSLSLTESPTGNAVPLPIAGAWIGLALVVGASALMVGASWCTVRRWIGLTWHQAIGTLILGAALAYLIPDIQQLWHSTSMVTLRVSHGLLGLIHPGQAVLVPSDVGTPLLGLSRGTKLIVTPGCADVESLAVFLLLGITLAIAGGNRVRWLRWIVAMAAGAVLIFVANAARLALLVELGNQFGSQWSVRFAHSRLGGILFLALSAGWLVLTRRWWQRTPPPGRVTAA